MYSRLYSAKLQTISRNRYISGCFSSLVCSEQLSVARIARVFVQLLLADLAINDTLFFGICVYTESLQIDDDFTPFINSLEVGRR